MPAYREKWVSDCGTVTLYLGDCLDILPTLELGSVDCVVTDPPYGIGITRSNRLAVSRGFAGETWDDQPCNPAVIDLILCSGIQSIIWGGNYFNLPPARCVLVWDKLNDGRDFADFEQAWTNLDSVARIFRKRPMNMDGGKVHPTQKPVSLMKWCVEFTKGETIIDPYAGSGTTGVACVRLGRKFIGIELEPKYFEIAKKRISDELNRHPLLEKPRRLVPQELFGADNP